MNCMGRRVSEMVEILVCYLCGAKFTEGNGGGKFRELHYSREIVLCPKCTEELLDFFEEWKETFAGILRDNPNQQSLEATL